MDMKALHYIFIRASTILGRKTKRSSRSNATRRFSLSEPSIRTGTRQESAHTKDTFRRITCSSSKNPSPTKTTGSDTTSFRQQTRAPVAERTAGPRLQLFQILPRAPPLKNQMHLKVRKDCCILINNKFASCL